jgi:hypothetical protein
MDMLDSLHFRFPALHFRFPARCLILFLGALAAAAQPTSTTQAPAGAEAAPAPRPSVSSVVHPALMEVQRSIAGLNIPKWKAPGDVRNVAQQNSASIQRDLSDTLPGLLTQADAAPGTVSPSFSVYRNIDALYDVLLRVYQTASLAAPQNEADSVGSALQRLEAARRQLGDTILSDSKEHEAQIVQLQAALKAATAVQVQAPPPKTAVIDDGPTPPAPKKKKKPAAKPPAANSTTQTPPGHTP